jgi:hypothetical protein
MMVFSFRASQPVSFHIAQFLTQSVCRLTVQRAILEIDSRGLDTEGIYRIPGKLALIQQVVQSIEQDEITFEFDPDRHDVHSVAGVLKVRHLH